MNSRLTYIQTLFSRTEVRLIFFLMSLILIFVHVEILFLILVSIGIPHVLIGLHREYTYSTQQQRFLKALAVNVIIAFSLLFISKELFIYITFFRFIIHFFEDRVFNYGQTSLPASVAVALLFFSLDFFRTKYWFIVCFSLSIAAYLYFNFRKRPLIERGMLFLTMFALYPLIPLMFGVRADSSSWSFNLAILHSVLWMVYDVHSSEGKLHPHKSNAFLIAVTFLICSFAGSIFSIYSYQDYFRFFYYPFYFLSFLHIFSRDTIRILEWRITPVKVSND